MWSSTSTRSRGRRLAVAAVLLLASGCAGARPSRGAARTQVKYRVVVENTSWQDVNVYSQSEAGAKFRLGTVVTGETRTFTVSTGQIGGTGTFRLVGDPIGSEQLSYTQWLVTYPGSTAFWRVGNHASTSYALVR